MKKLFNKVISCILIASIMLTFFALFPQTPAASALSWGEILNELPYPGFSRSVCHVQAQPA